MIPEPLAPDAFHSTRWSLIRDLDAADTDGRSQFNALCLRYWAPVHQYILDRGHDEQAARQLTQHFFARLHAEGLARATGHSRFRDFLASELDGFLGEIDAPGTAKDASAGEVGASLERGLALEVVAQSMARLRKEAAEAGHLAMFERLQRYLSMDPHGDELQREARALVATPLFVSLAIRRLRERFRSIVDDELTQLVTDPAQLAEERNAMLAALAHPR